MSPHSEDGAFIGNHPEQSQSVRNMLAEQSATPASRTSLQCINKGKCGRREAYRVHCPVELDGTAHL